MANTDNLQIPDKVFSLPPALIEKFFYFAFPLIAIYLIFSSLDKHLPFFQRNYYKKIAVAYFFVKILVIIFFLSYFVYFVYKGKI